MMLADYLGDEPDILEVISDLSNDEVSTPPKVARQILDLLPESVWSNPEYRWLDPGAKSGIFLREITKRLMVGLQEKIPNEQQRLEHILKKMVFGLAITELTSLISRRSLYCSKDASAKQSVVQFNSGPGNIWFNRTEHSYVSEKCSECNASRADMEKPSKDNHAYAFIHKESFLKINKELDMKFDVIVGNPPYQMKGGGGGTNDTPIYDLFVQQALSLNPKYVSMIIPSRWMAGGRGLDEFRSQLLSDKRMKAIVDFPNASEVFPGVDIKGGVCYFLWDRDHKGKCEVTLRRGEESHGPVGRQLDEFDIFVRDSRAVEILHKVMDKKETTFETIVSGDTPFGLASNYSPLRQGTKEAGEIKLHAVKSGSRLEAWIKRDLITKNVGLIDEWKVLIPEAGSDGGAKIPDPVLGKPLVAKPASVCTQTYLAIGPLANESEANNVSEYLTTKFARFMISVRKISQHALRSTYSWLPIQDFSKNWSDKELYAKYKLTKEEQAYIEYMIKDF
jgi:site-specific DNA-methyltransferase (adenine-specific)